MTVPPRLLFIGTALLLFCAASSLAAEADFVREIRPLLVRYCFDGHGAKKAKGDVDFERVAQPLTMPTRKLWSETHAQIRHADMPPDDKPQLTQTERARLLAWLEIAVEKIDTEAPPNAGRPLLRRLTRFEYRRTIRDLTGIEFDFQFDPRSDFPADGPDELKKLLLSRKDDFTRCLAEKFLTYALGRTPEPYDLRAIKRISTATASDGYKLSTLITEIVKSYPFRNRHLAYADATEPPTIRPKSK